MNPDDLELMQLIYQQTQALQTDVVGRIASGRPLTVTGLGDMRRQLAFLTSRVEDAITARGAVVAS